VPYYGPIYDYYPVPYYAPSYYGSPYNYPGHYAKPPGGR
jgi:hypothetical protein